MGCSVPAGAAATSAAPALEANLIIPYPCFTCTQGPLRRQGRVGTTIISLSSKVFLIDAGAAAQAAREGRDVSRASIAGAAAATEALQRQLAAQRAGQPQPGAGPGAGAPGPLTQRAQLQAMQALLAAQAAQAHAAQVARAAQARPSLGSGQGRVGYEYYNAQEIQPAGGAGRARGAGAALTSYSIGCAGTGLKI